MAVSKRRDARRLAIMAMHAAEATGDPMRDVLERITAVSDMPPEFPEFARTLCYMAEEHSKVLEERISETLENWKWDRLGLVERALLKLAAVEIFYMADIPPRVTINEYVDLAKQFAGDNAPKLVNGILDRLVQVAHKPDVQMGKARKS